MVKKLLLLLPLLTGVPLFVAGALRHAPETPIASFTPMPVTLAPDVAALGANAGGLLEAALDRVAPERLSWLHVKLWQRMNEPGLAYEAEGTLQLGPNHCARLDLAVRTGTMPGRWLVVSDGHALAEVTQFGSDPPVAKTSLFVLPAQPDQPPPPPPPAPTKVLREVGCGGPYAVLNELKPRLRELEAQPGRLEGKPMLRLRGRLEAGTPRADNGSARADFCYVYLDAQTLWPARFEWWGADRARASRLLLEMEFRDPERNRPLSVPECIREFTYKPAGT